MSDSAVALRNTSESRGRSKIFTLFEETFRPGRQWWHQIIQPDAAVSSVNLTTNPSLDYETRVSRISNSSQLLLGEHG